MSNIVSGIEIDEAKQLCNKIQVQALLIQNPTLLEYRERSTQSSESHSQITAEMLVNGREDVG